MLWWLLSEFGGYLAVGLGLIAAWFGLQWRGERRARAEVMREQEVASARAAIDRAASDLNVASAGADAARESLRRNLRRK